jgi:VanZ family protein
MDADARATAGTPRWYHSSRLHVVMYSFLLVATPFLILQRFLQQTIGQTSKFTFAVLGLEIPTIPALATPVVILLLLGIRKHVTGQWVLAFIVGFLMFLLGQQLSDHYFEHPSWELQQNWHYVAYSIFAFMMYRDLRPRGVAHHRIMLWTFVLALSFSTFDEIFQRFLSWRVFDVSDIAKDLWGAIIGMVVLFIGFTDFRQLPVSWRKTWHRSLGDYLQSPISLVILMIACGLIFLAITSLLSESVYWLSVILLTGSGFALFFLVFHLTQFRGARIVLLGLLILAIGVQGYAIYRHRAEHIVYNAYGLTVYKGIPIPFFDVLFFPDGSFRLVDKKHVFNHRDRTYFERREPDILLIGTGSRGLGGRGYPDTVASQFIFNRFSKRGTQVILLPTQEACEVFNRLKRQGKRVLFVLHNTC